MQYLDKLKKERSFDRVLFLGGMLLAFIGLIIPTVYVKQIVTVNDLTLEKESVAETSEELDDELELEDDDSYDDVAEYVPEEEHEFAYFASLKEITLDFKVGKDGNPVIGKDGNPKKIETVDYKYVIVDYTLDDEGDPILDENGKPKLTYVLDFDKDGNKILDEYDSETVVRVEPSKLEGVQQPKTFLFNVFGAAEVFNQHGYDYGDYDYAPGTAYNSTFLIIVWLCTIAGIVLFFITKTIVGDIIVVLLALAFGIASAITIPLTINVTPIVGYFSVGGYFVIIGLLVAIVGTVLGAAHIQHPSQVKAN